MKVFGAPLIGTAKKSGFDLQVGETFVAPIREECMAQGLHDKRSLLNTKNSEKPQRCVEASPQGKTMVNTVFPG